LNGAAACPDQLVRVKEASLKRIIIAASIALATIAAARADTSTYVWQGRGQWSDAEQIAEATPTPLPHAAGEKCATLRGQTGTDYYCASSVRAPQFGNRYGVDHLFSNSSDEAWVEGKPGQGVGEWITIDFREPRLVKAVIVRNGYQKSRDIFARNSRVRRLRLVFSQGETQTLTLADNMDLQRIALDPPVSASWVQFIIDDVYPGSTYADTAVTKLFLTSDPVR
jgi:hypothetical protein